jgi:hypothetical protein
MKNKENKCKRLPKLLYMFIYRPNNKIKDKIKNQTLNKIIKQKIK